MVLLGLAGVAGAEEVDIPFVKISTSPDELDLGTAMLFTEFYDVPAALTVDVESNCMHGPIVISTTELKSRQGEKISPERIFVKTPATDGFIPMVKPVSISKTMSGPHKIVLNLRVNSNFVKPAGEYTGTITLTVMPPV